jgi:hypothetical protein
MARWQYTTYTDKITPDHSGVDAGLEAQLEELGREGWELAASAPTTQGETMLIFKKPLSGN